VSSAKSRIWGTNDERTKNREKAFAMQAYFGLPSLFVTLTPDLNSSYRLTSYAGELINTDILGINDYSQLPTRSVQYQIATRNPYACAKLFDRIVTLVLSDLIGFDEKLGMSTKDGGIFGHVRAYAGSVETQGTGNLHFHFLLWIKGLPRTLSIMDNELHDELYGRKIFIFIHKILINII
jgi:hypothetical protein